MLHVTLLRIQRATTATDIYNHDYGKPSSTSVSFSYLFSLYKIYRLPQKLNNPIN